MGEGTPGEAAQTPRYGRVLLKVSGEALMGSQPFGIDEPVVAAIADEITSILMGDDVESRKNFIVTNAREVRNLDF